MSKEKVYQLGSGGIGGAQGRIAGSDCGEKRDAGNDVILLQLKTFKIKK